MIASLRGTLLDRAAGGQVIVEVGGVGYLVHVPTSAHRVLGEPGGLVFLHVHTHVRDDAIVLYGFPTGDERSCFEALVSTHGVGPGLALNILSVHSPAALRRAVTNGDAGALTLVPGIGRKTAARLLLELSARLGPGDDGADLVAVGAGGTAPSARGEVRAALAGLGYGADEVREALRSLPDDGAVEDLLRAALRQMAGRR